MYAVVDIETTGGNATYGKITEIAIFIHDGKEVVDQFVSLINPESYIPPFITNLTGITNEMVKDAPKFYEVAKKIVEITEGHIFVAHNAEFDYGFIRQEFKNLGYDFRRDVLCSVRLSKKIIPGHSSYGLGTLCKHYGIIIEGRHRAGGDAYATTKLLDILLDKDQEDYFGQLLRREVVPEMINERLKGEVVKTLPEETGIYYLLNQRGDVIYVGKSKNIRKRVTQHCLNPKNKKQRDLLTEIADVHYEITGSELVALLRESEEIKRLQPRFNRKQIRNSYKFGVFVDLQMDGIMHLKIASVTSATDSLALFSTKAEAEKFLFDFIKKYRLCPQKTGFERNYMGKACFHYSIQLCHGVCHHQETVDDYNERLSQAIKRMNFEQASFLILDKGRSENEKSIVRIEEGKYVGYGFADMDNVQGDLELLKDCTAVKNANREVNGIIKSYLEKNQVDQIIKY